MNKANRIPDTDEAWESGALGRDEQFVKVAPEDDEAAINESLGLQPISIRLEKSLIEDFKLIASLNGMGYQPLMRQALKRFAECEVKRILRDMIAEQQRSAQADDKPPKGQPGSSTKEKKAA